MYLRTERNFYYIRYKLYPILFRTFWAYCLLFTPVDVDYIKNVVLSPLDSYHTQIFFKSHGLETYHFDIDQSISQKHVWPQVIGIEYHKLQNCGPVGIDADQTTLTHFVVGLFSISKYIHVLGYQITVFRYICKCLVADRYDYSVLVR